MIFSQLKYYRNLTLKIGLGFALSIAICVIGQSEVRAQEKPSRYEKIQKRKNKANRRLSRRGDKAKKARTSFKKTKVKSRQGDRAYKGDITGRKVKTRVSPNRGSRAVNPQPNPYAGRKPQTESSRAKAAKNNVRYSNRPREKAWKGDISGRKVRNRGAQSRSRRLTPQSRSYLSTRRSGEKAWKGNIAGGKLRNKGFQSKQNRSSRGGQSFLSSKRAAERDGSRFSGQGFNGIKSISGRSKGSTKNKRITPRSASGSFTVRKRAKPYALRERSKWESAYKGDITGRKFKARSSSERPIIQKPPKTNFSFRGNTRRGDKAFKGKLHGGGYKSSPPPRERAWKNDISGNKLRIRTSQRPKFNAAHFKPSYGKSSPKGDRAFRGKLPGTGFRTAGRPIERAGKRPVPVKPPGAGAEKAIRFQGNLKASKPRKGGGSISGRRWNNNGRAVQGRGLRDQDQRISKFQGGLKQKRKGPSEQDRRSAGFTGNRKRWKYNTGPLDDSRYQGNLKARRGVRNPNAVKESLRVKAPNSSDRKSGSFTGNVKQWKYKTGPLDDSKYQGNLKARKGVRNPNAVKESLRVKAPNSSDRKSGNFTGDIKQWKYKTGPLDEMKYQGNLKLKGKYKHNPNAHKESLLAKAPNRSASKRQQFQGRFKNKSKVKQNPNSSKEALPGKVPLSATAKAMRFQGNQKQRTSYSNKPNAAKGSLKGIGPSKAAITAGNYQGNLKMRKGRVGDKHPSFKFDQPKNTAVEKTKFSLKLLWSRLFKKNENQPSHLKEKIRKPRFDKGEQGLWYD